MYIRISGRGGAVHAQGQGHGGSPRHSKAAAYAAPVTGAERIETRGIFGPGRTAGDRRDLQISRLRQRTADQKMHQINSRRQLYGVSGEGRDAF